MIKNSLTKVWRKLWSGSEAVPRSRDLYAVTQGEYLGEFFVYMEQVGGSYYFLSLPDMYIRSVPKDDLVTGIGTGVLELVEQLPVGVYDTCKEQYTKQAETLGTDEDVPSNTCSET